MYTFNFGFNNGSHKFFSVQLYPSNENIECCHVKNLETYCHLSFPNTVQVQIFFLPVM